jgi:hypothetical protein
MGQAKLAHAGSPTTRKLGLARATPSLNSIDAGRIMPFGRGKWIKHDGTRSWVIILFLLCGYAKVNEVREG